MDLRIETATKTDTECLVRLLEKLFNLEAEFAFDYNLSTQAITHILENQSVGEIIIAKDGDKVIGMVTLLYTISTALGGRVVLLEDMFVLEDYRKYGVGSQLLAKAKIICFEKNAKRITLLTDCNNTVAHNFYSKNGFFKSSMVTFRHLIKS